MRRWQILTLVSLLVAVTLLPESKLEAANLGKPVRVGLYYGETVLREVRLSSATGLELAVLSAGADLPQPIFAQPEQSSWAVRQDAFRLQFGPYDSLTAANSAMASLKGDDTRFVVQELGQYFVRFGRYNSAAAAEQVLKLISGQPGSVIGSFRVASATQADLASATGLCDQLQSTGLSAALAWVGSGWQVWVGHGVDAAAAETLRGQVAVAAPGETWTCTAPDLQRSEIYAVNGQLQCSVPAMDIYIGAVGAERGDLLNPALVSIHSATSVKQYRGFAQLTWQSSAYRVLLYLTVDQYTMGVLPAEVYTSWPADVLKAQALVSRNWAEFNRGKHGSAGFDFCTTTNCQVYVDYSAEKDSTRQAVIDTANMYIAYNGQPVPVYYSSDAGGFSESVENVWGGSPSPWLVGVEELFPSESAYAHWVKSYTGAELSALLKKNGISLGTVASVQVTAHSTAGRALGLRLVDTAGKAVTLTGETQLRLFYDLSSRRYTVQADIPPVSVLGADGTVTQLPPTGLQAVTAGGSASLNRTDSYRIQGATAAVSSAATAPGFVFVGSGSGHGAGLSQWGAYAMAKNGYSYQEIIRHYFQGTEILQLGD